MLDRWSEGDNQMVKGENKLTAMSVKSITQPGRYRNSANLFLQVTPTGVKSWLFRYQIAGRDLVMGFGPVRDISLAKARELAHQTRLQLLAGIDPLKYRDELATSRMVAASQRRTFGDCSKAVINSQSSTWRNRKSRVQWEGSLNTYASNLMAMPVDKVILDDIVGVLGPIWKDKHVTAERVRGRIEQILDWATASGFRSGDNPAKLKGPLVHRLPKVRRHKIHLAAVPWQEMPSFMAELRNVDSIAALALEFTILTAARTNEILGAHWEEIDLAGQVWTIPAERTKTGKEHRVPLSPRAMEILAFPIGSQIGRLFPIGHNAMLNALKALRPSVTVHGFRSTFRDWCAEATDIDGDIAEMALGHAVPNAVERAYRRGDLFDKRRSLMNQWAEFLGSTSRVLSD